MCYALTRWVLIYNSTPESPRKGGHFEKKGVNPLPRVAGFLLGFKHSEESLVIMSLNNKGKVFNKELKALLSEIKKGVPLTDEHKSLINQAKKGVPLTDAHKTALNKARENIVFSDTHKMNMSIANGT
jgi:transcriptional regulator with PAS, ATPase and Fis domain